MPFGHNNACGAHEVVAERALGTPQLACDARAPDWHPPDIKPEIVRAVIWARTAAFEEGVGTELCK